MKYKVGILGSTGSIGQNSLEVIKNLRKEGFDFEVVFISGNSSISILKKQADEFKPKTVFINNESSFKEAKTSGVFNGTELLNGEKALNELAGRDNYNILINSFVGFAGTLPTIAAIKAGKKIALANKETMVVAGKLINELCALYHSEIIPIDSEHSAILQCLMGEKMENVKKIILTASGGPFRGYNINRLKDVTVSQALKHPNWNMGNKITIDSATMMNKGLELIEAKWLFKVSPEILDVVIHPQSIIHSMIEFHDTSIKSQLGIPDMKVPIQFALTYPERIKTGYPSLDLTKVKRMDFESVDLESFKCLKLAYDVMKLEGTYPAVLNAANEIAVDLYLKEKIKFTHIADIIDDSLSKHKSVDTLSIEDIIEADAHTRKNLAAKYY
ncbi:MAG: 1-deoxy-D-xylulose-5-phosphate reductoisomerase [Ignavibacteria bacterium]